MFRLLLASLLMTPSIPALAGPNDSGGGKVVVCRDEKNAIKSVELLDLWEAREIYERTIVESNEDPRVQYARAAERIKHAFTYPFSEGFADGRLLEGADALLHSMQSSADGVLNPNNGNFKRRRGMRFTLTPDSYEDMIPEGCSIEQIVLYKDTGLGGGLAFSGFVNQDLYDRLSPTGRAGLALHEAFYAELRKLGEVTSIRARRAVGFVMAGGTFEPLAKTLEQEHVTCSGNGEKRTRVHIVKQPNGLVSTWPEVFKGSPMIGVVESNSGIGHELAVVMDSIKHGGVGWGVGLNQSPVDFDLSAMLDANGGSRVTFRIERTASGLAVPQSEQLECELIPAAAK